MSKAQPWFELAVTVAAADEDAVTSALDDAGFGACELRAVDDERTQVVVCFQATDREAAEARRRKIVAALPASLVEATSLAELDATVWTESWREHFSPLEIGERLLVLPPWAEPTPEQAGRIAIVINPAMAFGTGHHATTAGCLVLLEKYVRAGDRVADIGTGSGILAIAARKLGADYVYACDIDEEAVNAARTNAVTNHVQVGLHLCVADGPPVGGAQPSTSPAAGARGNVGRKSGVRGSAQTGQQPARFHVVVANILAETLAEMGDRLTSCVMSGGHLVLAGIESQRLPLIEVSFDRQGWTLTDKITSGEWITLAFEAR